MIYRIRNKAIKQGYNPAVLKLLVLAYIIDKPKLGRPSILIADIIQMIKDIVTKNSITRSWSYRAIILEVAIRLGVEKSVYAKSVYKVLKAKKYKSCKLIIKPSLIDEIKKAWWEWCLAYENWTMEDWKNVI